jgi:hypothetical protein
VTAEQFGQRKAGIGAVDGSGMPTDPAHPWNRMAGPTQATERGATKPAQPVGGVRLTRGRTR